MQNKQVKQRAHKALFDTSLPFRARTERSVKQYKRNSKHRNRGDE